MKKNRLTEDAGITSELALLKRFLDLPQERKDSLKKKLFHKIADSPQSRAFPVKTAGMRLPAFKPIFWWGISLASLLFLAGAATFAATLGSQPGDRLYGVKLLKEKLELELLPTYEAKALARAKHAERRLFELQEIKKAGRENSELEDLAARQAGQALIQLNDARDMSLEKNDKDAALKFSERIDRLKEKAKEEKIKLETEEGDPEAVQIFYKKDGGQTDRIKAGNPGRQDAKSDTKTGGSEGKDSEGAPSEYNRPSGTAEDKGREKDKSSVNASNEAGEKTKGKTGQ